MIASHSFTTLSKHSASIHGTAEQVDSPAVSARSLKRVSTATDGEVDRAAKQSQITDSFTALKAAAEKAKEAADQGSFWTTLGTIVMGPLIGTAIGTAIGGAANDDESASRAKPTVDAAHARIYRYSNDRDP